MSFRASKDSVTAGIELPLHPTQQQKYAVCCFVTFQNYS